MQSMVSARKMWSRLGVLVAVGGVTGLSPALAQTEGAATRPAELVVGAAEIRLEGRIRSVDAVGHQLVLDVATFTLPNGKTSTLAVPKPKPVVLDERSALHVRGDVNQPVKLAELTALETGVFAVAVGADTGTGKSLTAREVAVWDRVEAGVFRFKDSHAVAVPAPVVPAPIPVENVPVPVETQPATGPNVFQHGDFEQVRTVADLTDWRLTRPANMRVVQEGGNHFLRLTGSKQGDLVEAQRSMRLDPEWKTVWVQVKVRTAHLDPGELPWWGAQLSYVFEDATGKTIPDFKAESKVVRTDQPWTSLRAASAIKDGAVTMVLSLRLWGANGTADFDDIQVTPDAPVDEDHLVVDTLPIRKGLPEGTFETLDAHGVPAGWMLLDPNRMKVVTEDGNNFLRLTNERQQYFMAATCRFAVEPSWLKVKVLARMRVKNLKPVGGNGTEGARLAVLFEDAGGNRVGPWQPALQLRHDADWTDLQEELSIPAGAAIIKLSAELINTIGTVDYDDIRIEPGRP